MASPPTAPLVPTWICEGTAIFLLLLRFGMKFMLQQRRQGQQKPRLCTPGDVWVLCAAIFIGLRLGVGIYAAKYGLREAGLLLDDQQHPTQENAYLFSIAQRTTILFRLSLLCIIWPLKAAAFRDLVPFLENATAHRSCRRMDVRDRLLSGALYAVLFLTFLASLLVVFFECPGVEGGSVMGDLRGRKMCLESPIWTPTYVSVPVLSALVCVYGVSLYRPSSTSPGGAESARTGGSANANFRGRNSDAGDGREEGRGEEEDGDPWRKEEEVQGGWDASALEKPGELIPAPFPA
ncbi:hypothetical protein F4810DRAFT_710077 [Camillea tinctor]|nr:hypothetical protein F4810DRAFT_710077 [Camillea tinctor]